MILAHQFEDDFRTITGFELGMLVLIAAVVVCWMGTVIWLLWNDPAYDDETEEFGDVLDALRTSRWEYTIDYYDHKRKRWVTNDYAWGERERFARLVSHEPEERRLVRRLKTKPQVVDWRGDE